MLVKTYTFQGRNYHEPLTLLIGWPWPKLPQSYSDTLAIRRAFWKLQGDILGSQAY